MGKRKILIVEDEFIIADVLQDILGRNKFEVCGIADTVDEAVQMVEKYRPELVLVDIYLKGKKTGIDLAKILTEVNIPFIYISANSNQQVLEAAKKTNPYGFIVKPFREKDVLVAIDIALYRYDNNLENTLRQQVILQKRIAQIADSPLKWEQKLLQLGVALQPFVPFEYMSVGMPGTADAAFNEIGFLRIGFEEYQTITPNELSVITNLKLSELAALNSKCTPETVATWYSQAELAGLFAAAPLKQVIAKIYAIKSHLVIPVKLDSLHTFCFCFYSRRDDAYHADHLVWADRFRPLLIGFSERMLADGQGPFSTATGQRAIPGHRPAVAEKSRFDGIIGSSHLLLNVFDQILQVAPYDTSVLILGESGTGKEKIAARIHQLSTRKDMPFVKVNCAALPLTLVDSELFGHEKGAFTGAYERKIGRFEMAHTGTIFLDEVGEIPLEVQVKLLRVLQEKEIERIGGRTTIKTDVRVIAATNRNLEKEVAEGRFRLDLYYRLNVIQLIMPPLRERSEDIPALIAHFLDIYNRKAGKHITGVSAAVLEDMKKYAWPGNIRELENLIERGVLLTRGDVIESLALPVSSQAASIVRPAESGLQSLSENEKTHITAALKKCNGKVWGKGGAAELLNLPPTTLNSKMKKLGIKKADIL
ncbi:sigma 54-interacting transcriptional regulator [Mucilaginibacter sp. L3T2-6]|uniref:sigma 54-interacting transcriptional regulator n=1 Tax=Mucilaginibacter sp. L3T2-6 TaxID=3062491 RepID=UPI002676C526|nr:sigma 54-interacting transcriptional regulator [Mucilaginibacter sp. L3T2-6]MDO3644374.1 sigma 54-interacting transcriptional regulator [Mucilaginibacter sp. L3T2-6]MDV6216826.1 sigma 54-interacting transcriptional regulator [Mucilaginibacter sp. L3T2-6]